MNLSGWLQNVWAFRRDLSFNKFIWRKKQEQEVFFWFHFPWSGIHRLSIRTVFIYQRIQNDRLKIVLIWRLQRWQPSGRFVIKQDPGWRLRMARAVPLTSSPLHSTLLLLLYIQLLLLLLLHSTPGRLRMARDVALTNPPFLSSHLRSIDQSSSGQTSPVITRAGGDNWFRGSGWWISREMIAKQALSSSHSWQLWMIGETSLGCQWHGGRHSWLVWKCIQTIEKYFSRSRPPWNIFEGCLGSFFYTFSILSVVFETIRGGLTLCLDKLLHPSQSKPLSFSLRKLAAPVYGSSAGNCDQIAMDPFSAAWTAPNGFAFSLN